MQTATKAELYRKAYERKVHSLVELIDREEATIQDYTSVVFLGVRSYAIARKDDEPKSIEQLNAKFQAIEALKLAMSLLTPRMFMNIFPITKVYDGAKYQMKDYFSVMDAIKKIGLDAPIGEKIDDFLWDYLNHDINMFMVESMSVMSDIMQTEGKPGLMEQFAAHIGMPLYYSDNEGKGITGPIRIKKVGNAFCYDDSKARTISRKKKRPDYLRAVR